MKNPLFVSLAIVVAISAGSCRESAAPERSAPLGEQTLQRGGVKGHVRLVGAPPKNPAIRMSADPMCERTSGGKSSVQETVIAGADGSLANVFVQLQGSFPETTVPAEPVAIDQRACLYSPRMVGVQIGQVVRVQNSDPGLHNVHGISAGSDGFNIAQPIEGMVSELRLKEPGMMRLQCDVHTWMVAFIGVVSHPYFAATGAAGTFELHDVPVGTHTIQAWHERYGTVTASVVVQAGSAAEIELTYSGEEKRTADGRPSKALSGNTP